MKKIIATLTAIFFLASAANAGDYYTVGVDCFKKENFSQAAYNLEKAVRISPKNVNARYYLAQTYLTQKRIPDATDQYRRIILIAPSSTAARLSQKGLSLINESLNETPVYTVTTSGDLAKYKDNYLEYILPSGRLVRWHSFPIKVFVEPGKYQKTVIKAIDTWKANTENLLKFEQVANEQNAQLTIDFQSKLESTSTKGTFIAGYSKPYYRDNNIIKSEIHLLTVDPATGEGVDEERLYRTSLHELGHSLGFNGHSPKKTDIMYSTSSEATNLTKRDINTMTLLYKLNKETFASRAKNQSDVQLQQAMEYVKTNPEKSVGWANLGDIYRGKKMYTEAIKNYKKAVSLEPEKADLHCLLGTSYALFGDNKNAFTSLKTACDLDKMDVFYLYQFCSFCAQTGQKAVGQEYLNSYLKANPQGSASNEIKRLKGYYK